MLSLPRQVWLLTFCYALMLSGTSMLVLIAGIIGTQIAPSPELATLPVALGIVGIASNTLVVSWLSSRFGRKSVFLGYAFAAILAALLACFSLTINSFGLFCLGSLGIGASVAAVQQYRFAAIEAVAPDQVARTASTILLGGIAAAIVGPELTLLGQSLYSVDFVGSFFLLALVFLVGLVTLLFIDNVSPHEFHNDGVARPFMQIVSQKTLLIAVLAAAVGYAVMSFIMTATPISMHAHHGHSLIDTKWVIQSHVAAMYLPSLISGRMIERLGYYKMMMLGLVAFLTCLMTAFLSQSFLGYWSALILLGIGWNFLFVSGTALLPTTHRKSEKFKIQAFNDFSVFGTQAIAALSSGWILFKYQWQGVLTLSLLPILIISGFLLLQFLPKRSDHAEP